MRHPKAVLFDLYDTLTYTDKRRYNDKIDACSKICRVLPGDFEEAWNKLVIESNLGKFRRTEDRVKAVLSMLKISKNAEVINKVTDIEHEFLRSSIYLFDDAIDTLALLRNRGFKLGLVTNASPSVQIVLKQHKLKEHMDCVVISSDIGYRKPDARIYETALEKLGLKASDCYFVGDGNDGELDGAHGLGFVTICVKRDAPKHVETRGSLDLSVDFTVSSLKEVVNIVEG